MKLVEIIVKAIDDKHGHDIKVLDFAGISPLFDYFVICDVDTDRQLNAVVEGIEKVIKEHDFPVKSIQGDQSSGWIIMDLYDVIVHVFTKEQREYYQLERLWSDHKIYEP